MIFNDLELNLRAEYTLFDRQTGRPICIGKSTTQSYRTPVYYVDLTLRDGVNLQHGIQVAKDIDQQSKQSGFNQSALDQTARQGFADAQFEVNSEEGLDLVEEFYSDENQKGDVEQAQSVTTARTKAMSKPNQGEGFVQDMQKGLQGSVRAVN